jgi:hypothetical protein
MLAMTSHADAAFIAKASPPVVLALLDVVDAGDAVAEIATRIARPGVFDLNELRQAIARHRDALAALDRVMEEDVP